MSDCKKILLGPVGLLLFAWVLRLPGLWIPVLDVDETQFVGFAQVLLDGGRPYLDSLDTKSPGMYLWAAAALFLIRTSPMIALHLATIGWVWLSGLALGALGTRVADRRVGRIAAFLYVGFSAGFVPKWISTSITQVMNAPLIVAMLCLVLAVHVRKLKAMGWYFLGGLAIAAAFNFKYQGGIQLPIVFLALPLLHTGADRFKKTAWGIFALSLGFLVGVGAVWTWLFVIGVWPDFWQWSVLGSFHYIALDRNPLWSLLFSHVGEFIFAMSPLFWLALTPVCKRDLPCSKGEIKIVLWIWFALTWVSVSVGGRFYHHYFLQLLPPLVLLAAIGACTIYENGRWRRWMTVFLLMGILLPVGSRFFFVPLQRTLGEETFEGQEAVGKVLRELATSETPPSYVFVWGFATPIYTFSGLKPASRFLWADLLSGRFPGPRALQEEAHAQGLALAWTAFWEDMQKRPPRYFVDTSPADIHDYGAYPISNYPRLQEWVHSQFDLCREVDKVDIYCRRSDLNSRP